MRSNEINEYEYWIPLVRTSQPIVRSVIVLFDSLPNIYLGNANLIPRFSFPTNPILHVHISFQQRLLIFGKT